MKKIGLFLLVATMGLFAACSSDKKYEEEIVDPKTDYAKEIEGTYKGMLDIAVPNDDPLSTEDVVTLTRTKEDVVKLELNDFSFEDITVGDIIIEDVIVVKEGDNIVLKEKTSKIKLSEELGGTEVPVTVSGKFVNGKLNLEISITDVFPEAIKVTFSGTKTDSVVDYAKELAGTYKGPLNVTLPGGEPVGAEDIVTLKRTGHNLVKLELNNFSFEGIVIGDIVIEDVPVVKEGENIVLKEKTAKITLPEELGNTEVAVTVTGTSTGGKLNLDLSIADVFPEPIKVNFNGDKLKGSESAEAKILSITFDHEAVLLQPTVEANNTTITLYVKDETDITTLTEVPVAITVSEKATVLPASGSKVDLSEGSAKFVVLAENGTKVTYTVNTSQSLKFYDFEEWISDDGVSATPRYFKPVGGWASPNAGTNMLTGLSGGRYSVVEEKDPANVYAGKSSAKIESLLTAGSISLYPGVTPGTLFLGHFRTEIFAQSTSARFGIATDSKPLEVRGYYKYTPGEKFYEIPDLKKKNVVNHIKDRVDECSIDVYVYEYDKKKSDEDAAKSKNPYSTYINGADLKDANGNYNSRIVGRAHLADRTAKAEYTAFSLKLEYTTYDATKNYRIAVIATPSKAGDEFKAGDGSTLWIDDIEIITE